MAHTPIHITQPGVIQNHSMKQKHLNRSSHLKYPQHIVAKYYIDNKTVKPNLLIIIIVGEVKVPQQAQSPTHTVFVCTEMHPLMLRIHYHGE